MAKKTATEEKASGLGYSDLKKLYPVVREASQRQEVYSQTANHNPEALESMIEEDAQAVGMGLEGFRSEFYEAEQTKNWSRVAQVFPSAMINARYGEKVGKFNTSLSQHPEDALVGAPERVVRAVVLNTSEAMIKSVDSYDDYSEPHLEIKSRDRTQQELQSSDSKKRIGAQKTIMGAFENKYQDIDGASKQVVKVYHDIANALGSHVRDYVEETRETVKTLVKKASEEEKGREYLGKVASEGIREAVMTDLTRGLPEE